MEKDYRENQKVIATLELEDKGQDFIEIDVLENGVILGHSPLFENGRLSMVGIGTLDGMDYIPLDEFKKDKSPRELEDHHLYFKETGEVDPLPWEAKTFKYKVLSIKKATKVNRFINKNKK